MREEVLRAGASPAEEAEETTLRPRRLAEFVGQPALREHLEIVLGAARRRGQAADHLLFAGPPGLGKTTLAGIVAAEMGVGFRITSGPALERSGDLAAILTNLDEGDVLFIDEIHRLHRIVEEVLYPAMEDFCLDIVIGKGPSARSIRLDLPRFTLVGATTRTGLITGPLRDRFGFVARLDYYDAADLEAVVVRAARILGIGLQPEGAAEIAVRSRGTPRIANRLLRLVRDFAEIRADGVVTGDVAREARRAGLFLVLGALSPTEIVAAVELGADLVKVYPLPPVGGPAYLSVIRGPLGDVPMLAAGGFGVEEIPAYRQAGAIAFGLAAPLLGAGAGEAETRRRTQRAITLARGTASLEEKR